MEAATRSHATETGAIAAASLASIFFGGMVFSTRFVVDQTTPLELAFLRFGIGALCMAPVLVRAPSPRVAPGDWAGVCALGVILYAVMPVCIAAGMESTYASRGGLVLASQPMFTLLLSRFRNEERLSAAKVIGIAITALGLAVALGEGASPHPSEPQFGATSGAPRGTGELLLILAACCTAVYNVYARPYLRRYNPFHFTALTMAVGATALVPWVVVSALSTGPPQFTPLGWLAVFYIGTLGAAAGFSLWVFGLRHTTPTRVAVCLALNPITAAFLGWAFLDEPLTAPFFVGAGAVLLGIYVTTADGFPARTRDT